MNYIKELNAFAAYRQYNKLSAGQIAMWHAIIEAQNAHGWCEWVTLSTAVLAQSTGLKSEGIKAARKALIAKGLIEYRSHGTNAPDYRIVSLSENNEIKNGTQANTEDNTEDNTEVSTQVDTQDNTQVDTQTNTQDNTQDNTQVDTQTNTQTNTAYNKLNKTKDINNIYIPPYNPPAEEPKKRKTASKAKKTVGDVFAEYAKGDSLLLSALRDYEQHRVKLGKRLTPYKAELRLKELDRLGGDDAGLKLLLIRQTIDRGWQSFYELKDEHPKAAEKPPEEKKENASRYDFAEIRRRDRERLKRLAEEEI